MHPKYVATLVRLAQQTDAAPVVDQLELDAILGGGAENAHAQSFLAPRLRAGTAVRITALGPYLGLTGVVEALGRTRYKVKTENGILRVPPALLEPFIIGTS